MISPELHEEHRDEPPSAGEAVVHAVDRAVRGRGGGTAAQSAVSCLAEADLLALHVALGQVDAQGRQAAGCRPLGPVDDTASERSEHHHHRRQKAQPWRGRRQGAEGEAAGSGDRDGDSISMLKLVERVRVLERVRGVDVEEAAAIGAELLDRFLEATGPSAMTCVRPTTASDRRLRASAPSPSPEASAARPPATKGERHTIESGSST
jgi:hypothetical protein